MSRDARPSTPFRVPVPSTAAYRGNHANNAPRMRYRNSPVSIAVDPISLVISECISITSAIQKHARSPHSSVSAILGGSPNPLQLASPRSAHRGRTKSPLAVTGGNDSVSDALAASNRWGLRGQKGRSMQDNPMVAGFGKLRHEVAAVKGAYTLTRCTLSYFGFITQLRNRHPILRWPFALGSLPACYPGQGYCSAHNHSCAGGAEKVSRLWLRLLRLAPVCASNAVAFSSRDALSVRRQ